MTAAGEAGAQIYAAAAKREQAGILFADAVKMVRQSPALARRLEFSGGPGREFNIAHHGSGSFFRPVSRDTGKTGSGPRPYFVLADEIHELPDRSIIEILERGFKFRREPLLFMITNSGSDRNSVAWEEYEHAVKVAAGNIDALTDPTYLGEILDDTTFSYVCALDDGNDPLNDPACWIKANPLLGITISEELSSRRSAPFPLRQALFSKGPRTFKAIGGSEHGLHRGPVPFLLHGRLGAKRLAAANCFLGGTDRHRTARQNLRGPTTGGAQYVILNDFIDDAKVQRLPRGNPAAGEQDTHRPRRSNNSGQALDAPCQRSQTNQRFRQSENSMLGGDNNVGCQHHLEAAPERRTVGSDDDRLGKVAARCQPAKTGIGSEHVPAFSLLLEIVSSAEGLVADGSDDGNPLIIVIREGVHRSRHLPLRFGIESISGIRAIDRDDRQPSLALDRDEFAPHATIIQATGLS